MRRPFWNSSPAFPPCSVVSWSVAPFQPFSVCLPRGYTLGLACALLGCVPDHGSVQGWCSMSGDRRELESLRNEKAVAQGKRSAALGCSLAAVLGRRTGEPGFPPSILDSSVQRSVSSIPLPLSLTPRFNEVAPACRCPVKPFRRFYSPATSARTAPARISGE